MSERWLLSIFIVILVALILIFPIWGMRLQTILRLRLPTTMQGQVAALQQQNEVLKAQVAENAALSAVSFSGSTADVAAPVFSQYPFDLKNELLIARGTASGVAIGQSVVTGVSSSGNASGTLSTASSATATTVMPVLIGRIDTVSGQMSTLVTIFDPQWRSSVRIGASGAQGLLTGGTQPEVTLISKDAVLNPGDVIYNADARFPYGLPLGEVQATSFTPDRTSQNATLTFPYDINTLTNVFVVTNYDTPLAQ